ncbi:MAG: hypothetical protein ACYTG2_16340 [Planctomycetota bacterium]|jgi:hypothetical protein
MGGLVLDLLFDWVVERGLLAFGARILWALRLGRVPLNEQMQRTGPNLATGLLAWGLVGVTFVQLT